MFLITALLLFAAAQTAYAAAKPEDLDKQIKQQEAQYKKIQGQISANRKKLSDTIKKEKSVTQQVANLSQKITVTQQKVNVVSLNVRKVRNNIASLQTKIKSTTKNIEKAQELLGTRLVSIYKYGGVAEFNLLMSSQGALDALNNSYLLGKIAEQDKGLIEELRVKKAELEKSHKNLQIQKAKLETQVRTLNNENRQLKNAANERNALLGKVRKNKALYIAEQNELQRASKELQATVKRLMAEKRKLAAKKNPGKKATVYYKGGKLGWPLGIGGRITSNFGTRTHPVFKTKTTHTGIDISAPKGTAVKAANAGETLFTGWLRGYGQVIIIDHGANLTTVYAHLSKIETSEGAKVSRGQTIGRVGATGIATGNHLHFEVRVKGEAVNPMKYLR
jgi:murein DD-endopeptidase MepM/ murein hydrolase activator NlpD